MPPVDRGGGHRGAERGNRVEQLAAVADRGDAQILRSSAVSSAALPIDLVVAERLGVALKAKPVQPRRYVHAVILGSEERQPLMDDDSSK